VIDKLGQIIPRLSRPVARGPAAAGATPVDEPVNQAGGFAPDRRTTLSIETGRCYHFPLIGGATWENSVETVRTRIASMTLPNVLGLGAQRAGTTWLDGVLRRHPAVYLPTRRKEVHFFDRHYDRGNDWYSGFFPSSSEASEYKWIGEITPAYLYNASVPSRISETLKDCRFIVNLRNPADRAYSQYRYDVKNTNDRRSFLEFIDQDKDVLRRGLYADQIERYFSLFNREHFLILIFEEFVESPLDATLKISDFLQIDPRGFDPSTLKNKANISDQVRFSGTYAKARRVAQWFRHHDLDRIVNAAKKMGGQRWPGAGNQIPELDPATRGKVLESYRDDIARLEALTAMSFDTWLADKL
jgi:hypothetical protein